MIVVFPRLLSVPRIIRGSCEDDRGLPVSRASASAGSSPVPLLFAEIRRPTVAGPRVVRLRELRLPPSRAGSINVDRKHSLSSGVLIAMTA